MRLDRARAALTLALAVVAVGCSDDPTALDDDLVTLLSVQPQGGEINVPVGTSPTLRFDHPLGVGMESFAALHRGGLSGPEVDGTWAASSDRMTLTFDPSQPLMAATDYTVHIGAGMTDDHGQHVSLGMHGPAMGGDWVTSTMMTGAMGMGGLTGTMMGPGWAHPTNGSFGMIFTFTTAG